MTKTLDKGEDKIQQICDILKQETLEPAKEQATKIVEDAEREAKNILAAAEKEAANLIEKGQQTLLKERSVFDTSLKQATAQCFESLKQKVQKELFNEKLAHVVSQHSGSTEFVAKVLNALVSAIEKEGTSADLQAVFPKQVSARDLNAALVKEIMTKLETHPHEIGDFSGGAQVKILDKKLTLDLCDRVLKELLSRYLREDFRELLFQA